jgi:hypothetical protein
MGHFKNLLKNHKARKAQIYTKASLDNAKSRLYKSWSPGAKMGKTMFTYVYVGKKSLKIFSRISWRISIKLYTNHSCMKGIQFVQTKIQVLFKGEIITKM